MPRIPDDNLDCAFYLYPTIEAAKEGIYAGGSGFFVGIPSRFNDVWFLYAVTNRHVIKEGYSLVLRLNSQDGSTLIIESEDSDWQEHPAGDDIAVAPIRLHPKIAKFNFVTSNILVTPEIITEYDIGIGDDVYMVGRFINHEGKQNNMPSLRFGNISVMPIEPIKHPNGYDQESFAVEMRSLSGYSGSPVFVRIENFDSGRKSSILREEVQRGFRYHAFLLGIEWGHISDYYRVYIRDGDKYYKTDENLFAKANTNMAGVVPAWKLLELLQHLSGRLNWQE